MTDVKFFTVAHLPGDSFKLERKRTEKNPKPGSIVLSKEQYLKFLLISRPCTVYLFDQREEDLGPVSVIHYD